MWIFGTFYWRNGFCDEVEWHYNFSHFSRARTFPLGPRKNQVKFGIYQKNRFQKQPPKECSLFYYIRGTSKHIT